MKAASHFRARAPGGIGVALRHDGDAAALGVQLDAVTAHPLGAGLWLRVVDGVAEAGLADDALAAWAPGHDTLGLAGRLADADGPATLDAGRALEREILAAMLLGPVPQWFPSLAELQAAVRIRANIARAAAATALSFHTTAVARPFDLWDYDEDRGFIVRPGASLVEALRKATQPGVSGTRYAFSCYRATEYVMLLGLAEELQAHQPATYAALERLWQQRAVVSGEFHDVFLRECGSLAEPLPPRWYVPGDRVWFRNPDEASADASGYEGSWVIYLGGGLFGNFWKRDQPYDFDAKCIEVYHWRHATYHDEGGELRVDEDKVADHVARTLADPEETARVLARMQRYRDGRGIYAEGGCIDSTREQIKWVCEETRDLVLPAG